MKIGELSKLTGVSIRMLRYYEEQGLLKPRRSASGYRDYDQREVQTLERVKLLNSAGMTLSTIQVFLPCVRGERPIFEPCDELRVLLNAQLREVDEKVAQLAHNRHVLAGFLQEIDEGDE
ncbi:MULTISPECIES: MerR family transcriptional regulator [Pseudoalteromonas]|uniref:MerR family transcriptional regulator n=1 Tax=Pseudoalteromonas obscura TaxID=3048491 RepID=A0ABT7ENY6_9GAMM|nr:MULTISPECIES: MerR family transcriptional regulator [Pseudoalteromonas]MBQ4838100.1 MerR family transcriptional regulator [Pseudoalteromonas luteoviolacea]MDK2596728.1 MerR family transcriptional regulator [Pseudoalteromonas sp. P94(2023)]